VPSVASEYMEVRNVEREMYQATKNCDIKAYKGGKMYQANKNHNIKA
jgi:hypothetical protein